MKTFIITTEGIGKAREKNREALLKASNGEFFICPDAHLLGERRWMNACPNFPGWEFWESAQGAPGTICCSQGHLNLWRHFLTHETDAFLTVLEDDAVIKYPDLFEKIETDYDQRFLWGVLHQIHHQVIGNGQLWVEAKPHGYGSNAYIATRAGVQALYDGYQRITKSIDHYMAAQSYVYPAAIHSEKIVECSLVPSHILQSF